MKVLMVSINDISGGAARAAFRLHEALLKNHVDSRMLVENKQSAADSVIALPSRILWNKVRNRLNGLPLVKYKKTMNADYGLFSSQIVANRRTVRAINEIAPDIVHLHWVCGGLLSTGDIARINAPIVWSLHDMWPFTGGCHYAAGVGKMCGGYADECGNCDFLGSRRKRDLSFHILRGKKECYAKIKSMTVVGLSKWIESCAAESSVFAERKVVNLPNPIDTDVFVPSDSRMSRKSFNLPVDKKLILFGAMSATSTPHKGFAELAAALNKIDRKDVELVVFGSNEPQKPPSLPCKAHYLGYLRDDEKLAALYGACDVTVAPSLRENLSNTIMESLSCGTPVVCFDTGGNADMVVHKTNGFLARPFDAADLANGVEWTLNCENYGELRRNARNKIIKEFSRDTVAQRYVDLYGEVLNRSGKTLRQR
jgi:glycosyltransferase involved in cell wall biosynthesis